MKLDNAYPNMVSELGPMNECGVSVIPKRAPGQGGRRESEYDSDDDSPSENHVDNEPALVPVQEALQQGFLTLCTDKSDSSIAWQDRPRLDWDQLAAEALETLDKNKNELGRGDVNVSHVLQYILKSKCLIDVKNIPDQSVGCILHEEGLCKPCVFANKNTKSCRNGSWCVFCHYTHKEKRKRGKKKKKKKKKKYSALI
eukprot:Trichotokara_eunicae@DN3304_c0_g1_i1.p1